MTDEFGRALDLDTAQRVRSQWPGGMGGILIPPLPIRQRDIRPPMPPRSVPPWLVGPIASISPPPRATGGPATIAPPSPKSVVEVVYDTTPVAGIFGLLNELRDRRPRPLFPASVQSRVPEFVRARWVTTQRGAKQRLTRRKSVGIPIPRE